MLGTSASDVAKAMIQGINVQKGTWGVLFIEM